MAMRLALSGIVFGIASAGVTAQSGTTVSGTVAQADNNQPLAGALVVIDELRRETRTADEGGYRFDGVPAGQYHIAFAPKAIRRAAPK
jgi:hypothetical protein